MLSGWQTPFVSRSGVPTVRRGDFPFPLSHAAGESQWLTWIRNHSNYLAVRGMFDYVRILALLVRGALLNFIILLPWMLGVGAFVALRSMSPTGVPPYLFTLSLAAIGLAIIVISPSIALAHRVYNYRATQRSGSDTTVEYRESAERIFGGLLLGLAAAFAFESMSAGLGWFHAYFVDRPAAPATTTTVVGVFIVLYAFAEPLIRRLGGAMRRIAMLVVAAVGILVPVTVVMFVADYLALGTGGGAMAVAQAVWAAQIILSGVYIVVLGIVRRSLRWREVVVFVAVLIGAGALWVTVVAAGLLKGIGLNRELAGKFPVVVIIMIVTVAFCTFVVDINLSSIHGLYRDRLATAFLVGFDDENTAINEGDLDLAELSRHEAGSRAPYHIINAAVNLQGSSSIDLRDRRSDFFIFSKRFIGGQRTGYCRSEVMERVQPSMSLATAMAISAAAASPNMGRATSPALVALMTLLNIRLGVWLPNPGLLQDSIDPTARPDSGGKTPSAHGAY